jgi:hypothetical protein
MRKVRGIDGTDRSSDHHIALCGRNDCSRPASARLMLDMANRVVSIDMEVDEVGAGMLCYGHSERVVVPRGWTLRDDRVIEPYLFDGAPYDVEPHQGLDDVLDDVPEDNDQQLRSAPVRKERKRRKLITPASVASGSDAGNSDDPKDPKDSGVTNSGVDGQLSMGGAYDFPTEYETAADQPRLQPSRKRDTATAADEIEADRATSPLLARAFDMTKTRGANPKVKHPPED